MFYFIRKLIRLLFKLVKFTLFFILLLIISAITMNLLVVSSSEHLYTTEDNLEVRDNAFVLGASVLPNKTPSPILAERLDGAIDLYQKGLVKKIILSGDGRTNEYNEVNAMYSYVLYKGIPASVIVKDYQGLSTDISLKNYKNTYPEESLYIITQRYHLYRSLFIAKKLDLNAYGLASDTKRWGNSDHHIEREFFSRIKAFLNYTFPHLPPVIYQAGNLIEEKIRPLFY